MAVSQLANRERKNPVRQIFVVKRLSKGYYATGWVA